MQTLWRFIFIGIGTAIALPMIMPHIEEILTNILIGVCIGLALASTYYVVRFAKNNPTLFVRKAIYVAVAVVVVIAVYNILDSDFYIPYNVIFHLVKLAIFAGIFYITFRVSKIGDTKNETNNTKGESHQKYDNKTQQDNKDDDTDFAKADESQNELKQYYDLLEIPINATESQIKKAYRNLAKKYHPDINKSAQAVNRFIEIQLAYEIIMKNLKT